MVTRMEGGAGKRESLKKKKKKIEAHPAGDILEYIDDFDLVMLGPQIKHRFKDLEKLCLERKKPITVIDTKDYGSVNGGNILKTAILLKLESMEGK